MINNKKAGVFMSGKEMVGGLEKQVSQKIIVEQVAATELSRGNHKLADAKPELGREQLVIKQANTQKPEAGLATTFKEIDGEIAGGVADRMAEDAMGGLAVEDNKMTALAMVQSTSKIKDEAKQLFSEIEKIWLLLQHQFRAQFGETAYRQFIADVKPTMLQDGELQLLCSNDFQARWLQQNYVAWLLARFRQLQDSFPLLKKMPNLQNLHFHIESSKLVKSQTMAEVTSNQSEIEAVVGAQAKVNTNGANNNRADGMAGSGFRRELGSPLFPQYKLDQLVVGDSNAEAINAAKNMVEQLPRLPFNPLFIHGGVGMGKTHMLNGIGHYLKSRYPRYKILHFTAEDFVKHFVFSVRANEIFSFQNHLLAADCLLVDDLHFILGKEGALKALETITALFMDRGRMMVLVADRGPKELQKLGARLLSRLQGGVVSYLKPLNRDMRLAIIQMKSLQKALALPETTKIFLADKMLDASPRELEGVLNRLMVQASMNRQILTPENCMRILSDILKPDNKRITLDEILQLVARYHDISLVELNSKSRAQDVARPRQMAMYLCKKLTTRSLPAIGKKFGRDHTTVLHAIKMMEQRMSENPKLAEELQHLEQSLKGEHNGFSKDF